MWLPASVTPVAAKLVPEHVTCTGTGLALRALKGVLRRASPNRPGSKCKHKLKIAATGTCIGKANAPIAVLLLCVTLLALLVHDNCRLKYSVRLRNSAVGAFHDLHLAKFIQR